MLRRNLILIVAIACSFHARSFGQMLLSDPQLIQRALNFMPSSNGVVYGDQRAGGIVTLDAKHIKLPQPILLSTAQQLVGQGGGTVLEWNGPPGTSAIILHCNQTHGLVQLPAIRHLTIYCPNGANAVARDDSVKVVEDLTIEDVSIAGGGIRIEGENYSNTLRDVRIRNMIAQPLYLSGTLWTLDHVRVMGELKTLPKEAKAAVEIHGQALLTGYTRLEGTYGMPALYCEGNQIMLQAVHFELYGDTRQIILKDASYYGPFFAGTGLRVYWQLINSKAWVQEAPPEEFVTKDEKSQINVK